VRAFLIGLLWLGAVPAAEAAPARDTVAGWGEITVAQGFARARVRVRVDASSGPHGANPVGVIEVEDEIASVQGVADVTCLAVDGNAATVWGQLRRPVPHPTAPGFTWQQVELHITDSRKPEDREDLFSPTLVAGEIPLRPVTSCEPAPATNALARGTFTVLNAPP
jgi:hypothetical protein